MKVLTNSEPFGAGRPPRGAPLQSNGATAHFPPLLLIGAESTRGERWSDGMKVDEVERLGGDGGRLGAG